MEREQVEPYIIDFDRYNEDADYDVILTLHNKELIGAILGWYPHPDEEYIDFQQREPHQLIKLHRYNIQSIRGLHERS